MIQAIVYPFNDHNAPSEHLEFYEGDGWFGDLCDMVRESAEGYEGETFGIEVGKGRMIVNRYLQSL